MIGSSNFVNNITSEASSVFSVCGPMHMLVPCDPLIVGVFAESSNYLSCPRGWVEGDVWVTEAFVLVISSAPCCGEVAPEGVIPANFGL
jgi:hypothetical protein